MVEHFSSAKTRMQGWCTEGSAASKHSATPPQGLLTFGDTIVYLWGLERGLLPPNPEFSAVIHFAHVVKNHPCGETLRAVTQSMFWRPQPLEVAVNTLNQLSSMINHHLGSNRFSSQTYQKSDPFRPHPLYITRWCARLRCMELQLGLQRLKMKK